MADINKSPTELPGRGARDRQAGAGRLLGAVVRSVPGRRAGPRGDRRRARDLEIVKLNIDENQQTAASYQILAIPTMILFRNGQEAKRIQGAMPKKRLEAELEPALASDPQVGVRPLAERLRPREPDAQLAPLDGRGGLAVDRRRRSTDGGERLAADVALVRARGGEQLVVAAERAARSGPRPRGRRALRAFCTACTISRASPSRRSSSSSSSSSATACEPSRSSW